MTRHRLDDLTWKKLYACLQKTSGIYSGNEASCRKFINAVHWIMRTGAAWRDLPSELGNWNSVYKRFARWSDKKVWAKLHELLISEPDMEWLLIDSTVVRAHPCAAGAPKKNGGKGTQALGRSVGGFTTKIHATVDALGNPLRLLVTGGQRGDAPQAIALLDGFDFSAVLADRAYDSDDVLEFIAKNKATAIIPAKANRVKQRETDSHTYKERHLVECFINKIKQYRRIFSRFEKYAQRYLSFLSFASALIWLK